LRKFLHGALTLGLALSTIGAARLPANRLSSSDCHTQEVRVTLAGEQIRFCAPTRLPLDVVRDSASDPAVHYAGLAQLDGYGFVNIKATLPENIPGIDRPVYTSDGAAAYRRAVWEMESSRKAQIVSDGPAGIFWNETVYSIQVDFPLSLSSGTLQVRSIAWYVEHAGRLWSFVITWDTALSNAAEWEQSSRNTSVQRTLSSTLKDTAVDLGAAFTGPGEVQDASSTVGLVEVGTPSWWSGECNTDNFSKDMGTPSFRLGNPWFGVLACGPKNSFHPVVFGGRGEYEFQCVELVMRFLYLEWGIPPFQGNGNTIKNYAPSSMIFYPDGTHAILPGDVITEDASVPGDAGHTMLVTNVNVDGTGTGTIRILEQNSIITGYRNMNITGWKLNTDSWTSKRVQGWLHAKANTPGLEPDGGADGTFIPGSGASGLVYTIALQADGRILIGGDFTSYNGTPRNGIARLNDVGVLDTTFNPGTGVALSSGSPHVYTLALQSGGKVLIGGQFDSFNGVARKNIARLNSDGSLDDTFNPEINGDVYKIVVQANGGILVGGAGILLRLNTNGTPDPFNGIVNNNIYDILVQPVDGKILIGGDFTTVDGSPRAGIARLNTDGNLDTTFTPGTGTGTAAVASIGLQTDGKILIGGNFTSYNGSARNGIARLNSDGLLDGTFNPGSGISGGAYDAVQVVVPQSDGRIMVGGVFSSFNGIAVNHLLRLNLDGSRDTGFYASPDNGVWALVLQPDAKIIMGGDFTGHVARLLNHVQPCYTLAVLVAPGAGGTATIDTAPNCPVGKYISGTSVQVTAHPNTALEYVLDYWSGDASGSSNPLSVTMDANKSVTANMISPPGFFNKLAPADGVVDQPANPTLSWQTSVGATSYEYCTYISDLSDCDESSSKWVSTGASTSVTLGNLFPSVTYHWLVRARNWLDTTRGGLAWSFSRNGIPAVPVPVSPAGMMLVDHQPAFIWYPSAGATSYNLVVHSIDTASDVVNEVITSSDCQTGVCKKTYPVGTLPVGSYQFKLAAKTDTSQYSSFSAWKNFRVVVGMNTFLPLVTR
jgi:uncharacterized delta-60 repeat protein